MFHPSMRLNTVKCDKTHAMLKNAKKDDLQKNRKRAGPRQDTLPWTKGNTILADWLVLF